MLIWAVGSNPSPPSDPSCVGQHIKLCTVCIRCWYGLSDQIILHRWIHHVLDNTLTFTHVFIRCWSKSLIFLTVINCGHWFAHSTYDIYSATYCVNTLWFALWVFGIPQLTLHDHLIHCKPWIGWDCYLARRCSLAQVTMHYHSPIRLIRTLPCSTLVSWPWFDSPLCMTLVRLELTSMTTHSTFSIWHDQVCHHNTSRYAHAFNKDLDDK